MASWLSRNPLQQLANVSALFGHRSLPVSSSSVLDGDSKSDGDTTDTDDDSGTSYSDSSEDDLVTAAANTAGEDQDDDDEEYKDIGEDDADEGWTDELHTIRPHDFQPPSPSSAMSAALNECQTPLDYFHLIIPPAFITHMVQQTNLYAQQRAERRKENRHRRRSRRLQSNHVSWQPVTDSEMLAFLGCILYMGDVKIDNVRDYWEQTYYQSFVADRFPRDRFLALLRSFHLNDNDTATSDSSSRSLHKIQPLLDVVRAQSQLAYYPGQHLAADEAIAACKARSHLITYTDKHTQWGYKLWMLTECLTSYVWAFDVSKEQKAQKTRKGESGQTTKIVLQLVSSLQQQRWHIIAMDNYFTSVDLFLKLYQQGFYALGTAQARRRRFPRNMLIEAAAMERGEYVARQLIENRALSCVAWMDKSLVQFMDTYCDPHKQLTVQRRSKLPAGVDVLELPCPEVVSEYHQWMRAVDVFAQRESYHHIGRKARRWWPRLAWFIINIAINNAYALYCTRAGDRPDAQAAFRKKLMHQMVEGFTARKKIGRPPKRRRTASSSQHTVMRTNRNGDCTICRPQLSSGEHGRRSIYKCRECDVYVCVDCFVVHVDVMTAAEEKENAAE